RPSSELLTRDLFDLWVINLFERSGILHLSSIILMLKIVLKLIIFIYVGHFSSVWQGCLNKATVAVKVFPAAHRRSFIKEREVFGLPLMEHPGLVHDLNLRKHVLFQECSNIVYMFALLSLCLFIHASVYFLHKPAITHGDLSSSNVLVRVDGTCTLCNFGCATVLRTCSGQPRLQKQREKTCQCISQVGTLCYTSPEILEGCVNLNNDLWLIQGDVYALGLLLWELWSRCSDLYAESPVPEHQLPYEAELGPSPSLDDLILFVSQRRERPTLPIPWRQFTQVLYHGRLYVFVEDCWDHEPEARLTAQCAANRLAALPECYG
uniref:receptor protein serine/threonine kinase n=1 Tax=Paramormyrops kingsleyae TaxID=1676925 RepID=A0A3B3T651_9TELE